MSAHDEAPASPSPSSLPSLHGKASCIAKQLNELFLSSAGKKAADVKQPFSDLIESLLGIVDELVLKSTTRPPRANLQPQTLLPSKSSTGTQTDLGPPNLVLDDPTVAFCTPFSLNSIASICQAIAASVNDMKEMLTNFVTFNDLETVLPPEMTHRLGTSAARASRFTSTGANFNAFSSHVKSKARGSLSSDAQQESKPTGNTGERSSEVTGHLTLDTREPLPDGVLQDSAPAGDIGIATGSFGDAALHFHNEEFLRALHGIMDRWSVGRWIVENLYRYTHYTI